MNTQETECCICVENLNKSTRKPVVCEYCHFTACRECCQRFILNEVEPRCMNNSCGRTWSRKFIQSAFTNAFIKGELKKHSEDVLFDREKSLMPATQPIVENRIEIEKLRQELWDLDAEMRRIATKRIAISNDISRRIHMSNRRIIEAAEGGDFLRECPDTNCRGYLSTRWKCGVCSKWTCKECHTIKGDSENAEHECDPDTLASRRMIDEETRSCPKCRVSIYRIHGCDQMFCTKCNTAFDWRSGRIIHGRNIHNPHYFEWRNSQQQTRTHRGADEDDAQNINNLCMREMNGDTLHLLNSLFLQKRKTNMALNTRRRHTSYERQILDNARNLIAMGDYMVHGNQVMNINELNQELRIEFMRNNITPEYFKKRIQENEKKHMKELEIRNLFEMAYHSLSDIFLRYIQALAKVNVIEYLDQDWWKYETGTTYPEEVDTIMDEIPELLKYINSCFEEISSVYHSTVKYVITENLNYQTIKK